MSPLKDGLSFMDHVMEGVDAKSMNMPLDRQNVLIVRLMDVPSQKSIIKKYINLYEESLFMHNNGVVLRKLF